MNEETDQARLVGELIAQGRLRGEQLDKMERSVVRLGEHLESKIEAHTTSIEQKLLEQVQHNYKTRSMLTLHLAHLRGIKWAMGALFAFISVIGWDWWHKGG